MSNLAGYGWGAAGTAAKTGVSGLVWDPRTRRWVPKAQAPARTPAPAPPPTNPYEQPYQQSIDRLTDLYEKGPDYSGIPEYTPEQLDKEATTWADEYLRQAVAPYERLKGDVKTIYDFSGQMANNFGQAVALVFSGAAPGQTQVSEEAAQAYGQETFGSKYAIAAAVQQLGTALIGKVTEGFTERMFEISSKIADIYSRRPDLLEERKQYLLDQVKDMREAREATWQQRVELAGGIEAILRQQRTDWAEGEEKRGQPPNTIELYDGIYKWQDGKLVLLQRKPAEPGEGVSDPGTIQDFFAVGQETFERWKGSGVSRARAKAEAVKEMRGAIAAIKAQNPALAAQLTQALKTWNPAPVTVEKKEPERKSTEVTGVGLVEWIPGQPGSVTVLQPTPEARTEQKKGGQLKQAKDGTFFWLFPDGSRKPAGIKGAPPGGKEETPQAKTLDDWRADFVEAARDTVNMSAGVNQTTRRQAYNRLWAQFSYLQKYYRAEQLRKAINAALVAAGYPAR